MCTLILLHRCVPGMPLVVAANRDESLERPAAPPALLTVPGPAVVAPLDLRAGGTWLGVNRAGLFAALTSRPDPARRSRGLLVLDALEATSASAAARRLQQLPARRYNPFNLVVADAERAFALVYAESARLEPLARGVHVIGNADPLAPDERKVARLRARAEAVASSPADGVLDRLAEICRGHEGCADPLEDTCIHTPRYGTRSSALLRIGGPPATDAFRFADGPPCRTAYVDCTHLLGALDRRVDASPGPRIARTAS
jgi:uncharacterized protein with NRDE domain